MDDYSSAVAAAAVSAVSRGGGQRPQRAPHMRCRKWLSFLQRENPAHPKHEVDQLYRAPVTGKTFERRNVPESGAVVHLGLTTNKRERLNMKIQIVFLAFLISYGSIASAQSILQEWNNCRDRCVERSTTDRRACYTSCDSAKNQSEGAITCSQNADACGAFCDATFRDTGDFHVDLGLIVPRRECHLRCFQDLSICMNRDLTTTAMQGREKDLEDSLIGALKTETWSEVDPKKGTLFFEVAVSEVSFSEEWSWTQYFVESKKNSSVHKTNGWIAEFYVRPNELSPEVEVQSAFIEETELEIFQVLIYCRSGDCIRANGKYFSGSFQPQDWRSAAEKSEVETETTSRVVWPFKDLTKAQKIAGILTNLIIERDGY